MSEEEDNKRVEDAVNDLREHFDTVQILVTRHEGEKVETFSLSAGGGNWFARVGQAREWLARQDERTAEDVRKNG